MLMSAFRIVHILAAGGEGGLCSHGHNYNAIK